MYGNGVHFEVPTEAGEYFIEFQNNPALMREKMQAWLEHVQALPEVDASRVAVIGFCFGGQCALELARAGADIRAAISYHGLLSTHAPAAANSLSTDIAVYTGALDPYAPKQDVDALREEMIAAGARLQLTEFSYAYHSFTNPNPPGDEASGMGYSPAADAVSWAGTLALLNQVF